MSKRVIDFIRQRVTIDAPPSDIEALVYEVLVADHGEDDASEMLPRTLRNVVIQLRKIRLADYELERDPWFEFNSSSENYIQGPCFAEPNEPRSIHEAKAKRVHAKLLEQALQHIDWAEFETVCLATIRLLGVNNAMRTRTSPDQGIDFFGALSVAGIQALDSPFFSVTHRLRFWLVGQAKHYRGGVVSAPEVRNLVGSINLARFKEFDSTSDLLEALLLRSCDPVFALFMTTGRYSRNARQLASNSGVVVMDLVDVANFLADHGVTVQGFSIQLHGRQLADWASHQSGSDDL